MMTVHRLAEQSDYPCAFVFAKGNVVRYSVKSLFFEINLTLDGEPAQGTRKIGNQTRLPIQGLVTKTKFLLNEEPPCVPARATV